MGLTSVDAVKLQAAGYCGDPVQEVFTNAYLQVAFAAAWDELYAEMLLDELPQIEFVVTYTLPANTTVLLPSTAGINNFATLRMIRERPTGQLVDWVELLERDDLPQRNPMANLVHFVWRGGAFQFIGATQSTDLEITYWGSGNAPTTGAINLDGVFNFLWARTVAIGAPGKGYTAEAKEADLLARGQRLDKRDGYLFDFIAPRIRERQRVPVQPQPFHMGLRGRGRRAPYFQVP